MKRFIPTYLLFVFATQLQAKGSDTSVWKKFELIAYKNPSLTGSVRINLPPGCDGSIAELLNNSSALFLKYYSPGSLASTSMRGMGAQHTAILWNGINLQSSMNSNFDLNLMPAFFVDAASLETGTNASGSGNGAIGGALILNNVLRNDRKIVLESGIGSYGLKQIAASVSYRSGALSGKTRLVYREAEYDYPFKNSFKPGKPTERMSNNRFLQYGLMQELSYTGLKNQALYFNATLINTARQLPAVAGSSVLMNEHQDDFNRLYQLKHEYKPGKGMRIQTRVAGLTEKINYYNDFYPAAFNTAHAVLAETEIRRSYKNGLDLVTAFNYTRQWAFTDGYRNGKLRDLFELHAGADYAAPSIPLRISLHWRQLFNGTTPAPFTPELGLEYRPLKNLILKGNALLSYRLPSFNDLYWLPGGNPNLQPERGRKAELGTEYRQKNIKLSLTAFRHRIENWIMWLPAAGSSNWMAKNAKQVDSRGIEAAADWQVMKYRSVELRLFGRYQYVKSINTKTDSAGINALGKQLFYTPFHTGFANLRLLAGKYRIQAGLVYTGMRYTTADNTPEHTLEAYPVLNALIARSFNYKKFNSDLSFEVLNLANREYEVFEYRPMPGRNFRIVYKVNINYE